MQVKPTQACIIAANTDELRSNATFWLAVIQNFVTLGELENAAVAEVKMQKELGVYLKPMYYIAY